MNNKEVHYEGWLIKSPPTKRIWRARWRRRWFTLKQGEIPEQFCLEYYTDRNCRKLKGVIDLDQCEQVDCGLRLENRKQKFQFMFDIKTPRRTYYLAADTEADMRDWVNCICQVCHLHDTKQSNELQDDNRTQHTASTALTTTNSTTNNTQNTTTTSLNSSGVPGGGSGCGTTSRQQSINNDLLRRTAAAPIEQQPLCGSANASPAANMATYQNNDCFYVNAEYSNRETMLCDMRFDRQQLPATAAVTTSQSQSLSQHPPPSPGTAAALYLNSPVFENAARLAVNSNGVVRKLPENLVLNKTPLPDAQSHSVQPSPALSTASGPYIPISECFSGSPKFAIDANNPSTPLNNLDPKFYDTPRSHNNIGLNLTNDQSYSPKITNCGLQQATPAKNRSGRSDSDSDSVFNDDEEWAHPMPLRENVDRSTRPSDSSVENESFVFTFSQRFSKLPDDTSSKEQPSVGNSSSDASDPLDKLAKVLKNKNNLILDIKENEKIPRDMPQLSDTENTSPAIGPRDAKSVVDESYDIPRSHNLPYYNMGQLFEKVTSPEVNPIAASTPNLMAGYEMGASTTPSSPAASSATAHVRTLPRQHFYTNAAPSQREGNVFRYDFMEQSELPPVNRKLKPKVQVEDKPPEEVPAKPPVGGSHLQNSPHMMNMLLFKLMSTNLQNPPDSGSAESQTPTSPMKPPSVDRKLKPNAFKLGHAATLGPSHTRRTAGVPLSMLLPNECTTHGVGGAAAGAATAMETRTLPRQPRGPIAAAAFAKHGASNSIDMQHMQRMRAATNACHFAASPPKSQAAAQPQENAEHTLQYFDLDVANPPTIHRQSMSVGNLNASGTTLANAMHLALSADAAARAPAQSSVVYNSVDFVKTEAFKRIREERKKESEYANGGGGGGGAINK